MADQNEMDKVLSSMMEYMCDKLCRWPHEIVDEEEMSRICYECKMDHHICNILNTYNRKKQECIQVTELLPDVPSDTDDEHCPYFNVKFLNGAVN